MPGQLDLARALQGIETPTPVSGTAGLALRFEGPLETWRTGSAHARCHRARRTAGNLDSASRAARRKLRYERERIFVDSLEVDAGETRLSASGDLDAFEPARAGAGVLVTLTGEVAEVARAVAATGLTEVPIEGGNGPVALLARVNGSLRVTASWRPTSNWVPARSRCGICRRSRGCGCGRTRRTDGSSCAKAPHRIEDARHHGDRPGAAVVGRAGSGRRRRATP